MRPAYPSPVRATAALAAVLLLAIAGCGDSSTTSDTLNGTPQATRVVHDVEAIAHACAAGSGPSKPANAALVDLSKITAASPEATFGPAGSEVPMSEVLRRTERHFHACL
jgi:hypothetical protein